MKAEQVKEGKLLELLKTVNTAIQCSNMKNTLLHNDIRAAIKDFESAEDWTLSREKMPDFDGKYYVYGFMHHSCGNVTPFHKIVECKMNQWVKSDIGEQMTYWRNLLPEPKLSSHEQEPEHQKIWK